MTSGYDAVAFGRMQAEMEQMRSEMAELKDLVSELTRTLHEVRGGWRVLGLLIAAAGALGAAVTWWVKVR